MTTATNLPSDAATAVPLVRKFRMGATMLDDVCPEWAPERVIEAYVPNYPFLSQATLDPPVVEGNLLVYPIRKPVAQTKGASMTSVDEAIARLHAWIDSPDAPATSQSVSPEWARASELVKKVLSAPSRTDFIDPLFITIP